MQKLLNLPYVACIPLNMSLTTTVLHSKALATTIELAFWSTCATSTDYMSKCMNPAPPEPVLQRRHTRTIELAFWSMCFATTIPLSTILQLHNLQSAEFLI